MKTKLLAILVIVAMLIPGLAAPATAATPDQINTAIQNGLAWLATQQQANGQIGSSYPLADTPVAVLAFENEGNFPGGSAPYSANVAKGLDFMFQYCRITAINPQTYGNPDTNGNGQGIYFLQNSRLYETGIVMQTLAGSSTPGRLVTTGPCAGMTYQDVLTDMVDFVAWAQIDGGSGQGGWRYDAYNNASGAGDNSVSQWPVLGLVAAEQWGINAPAFVKQQLNLWVTYIQNPNGGSGYDGPYSIVNISKTGGLLVEFYYLGDDKNTARAQAAINYINANWNVGVSSWDGNKGHPYGMFSVFKGLELMQVATIPNALAHLPDSEAGDWYGDDADYLVTHQNANGSWPGYSYWDTWMTSGWYIIILQATILPVQVGITVPACACDGTGYNVGVTYSVERFSVDGTVKVYKDGVLFDTIVLTGFQGAGSKTESVASDTVGAHTWKAVLDVVGGGISAHAESTTGTVNVCETPQVSGIPDRVAPFQPFDLDDYLTYGGSLPVTWSVSGVPASWTVTVDADNVVTVVAPNGDPPTDLTFTASIECCTGVICSDGDTATFTNQARVFGYTFLDANGDGVRQSTETSGLPNTLLTLKQGATTIATALSTSPSGWYDFGSHAPGAYCIEAAIPAEYVFTSPNPACFTLGSSDRLVNFGVRLGKATVGDFVWYDTNANGIQDAGEAGIADVTLALAPNAGGAPGPAIQTATTGADGKYAFSDVVPGSYFVRVTDAHAALVGLSLTAGPQSKPNPAGPITVADSDAYLDADFGYTFACAESKGVITGHIWRDANADSKLDPGEPGIPAVRVCAAPLGHLNPFCTNTTPAGVYRLCVPPLTYLLAPDKSPASVLTGLTPTTPEFVLPAVIRPGTHLEADFGYQ